MPYIIRTIVPFVHKFVSNSHPGQQSMVNVLQVTVLQYLAPMITYTNSKALINLRILHPPYSNSSVSKIASHILSYMTN